MTPAEDSTACVTAFLYDACIDLKATIRRLDATVNRLADDALEGTGTEDAARVQALADQLAEIHADVGALYSKWTRPALKAAS